MHVERFVKRTKKERTKRFQDLIDVVEQREGERAEALERELERTTRALDKSRQEQARLRASFRLFSHDLKAPVRAILQLAEWVHDDNASQLTEDSLENLEMLKDRAIRLEKMHQDLSRYIRCHHIIEAPASLCDLEKSVAHLWRAIEHESTGRFEFAADIEPDARQLIAKQRLLETILHHLLSNAVHHHDREEGFISLTARLEQDGELLVLRVDDDGPGIAPHLYAKAMQPMKTLRARDKGAGTGLGLAIVESLIESVDGRLDMEYAFPASSRGLRVTCELPL